MAMPDPKWPCVPASTAILRAGRLTTILLNGFVWGLPLSSLTMSKDLGFLFVFSDPQGTEISDKVYHEWYDDGTQGSFLVLTI